MMRLKVPGVLWTDRQVDEYNEDFKNRYGYYWHEVFPHLDNDGNSNNNNNNNNNNHDANGFPDDDRCCCTAPVTAIITCIIAVFSFMPPRRVLD
jgi:hypothetical protein